MCNDVTVFTNAKLVYCNMSPDEQEMCLQCISSAIKTDRGSLFFKNIAADIRARKTLHPNIDQFFKTLATRLLAPTTNKGALQTLSEVAALPEFQLAGPVTKTKFGHLTTTITFDSLRNYYLDFAKAPIPHSLTDLEAAEFLGVDNIHRLLDLGARFRGGKQMVWLAPLDDILSGFTGLLPGADELRSLLGLSHFVEDQVLINIRFKPELVQIYPLRRPTALDGGPNLIFRTDTSRRKYGYTINLVGLANGAREVVSPPISTRDVVDCALAGSVQEMPSINWSDVSNSCDGDLSLVFDFVG
jgi:hypothetical protein